MFADERCVILALLSFTEGGVAYLLVSLTEGGVASVLLISPEGGGTLGVQWL